MDCDRVHDNLARIYYKRKFYALAEEEAKKALAINPNSPEAFCLLGTLFGEKRLLEQSIINLKKALKINPCYAEAYYNLGITYAKMGQFQEAIWAWQDVIRLNPYYKDPYLSIKRAQQILKKKTAVLKK